MQTSSIGVIGGADGPTAVFVTGSPWGIAVAAALAVLAVLGLAFLVRWILGRK